MIKQQRGYLLIIAIIAITVIGIIGAMLTSIYTTTARSTINSLESKAAFYIAKSGLEIARRDLLQTGSTLSCSDINSSKTKYNLSCYPPGATSCTGYFSVTGTPLNVTGLALAANITSTTTTINLKNTANILKPGVIVVDNEAIWYSGVNGTQLLNVVRGAFNTTASAHTTTSIVTQNTCTLTATGSVPTTTNPIGQRILQELLWKTNNNNPHGIGALMATDCITLGGNASVKNTTINSLSAPNIKGSTIASGKSVTLSGSAQTSINNGIVASTAKNPNGPDIDQKGGNITTSTLWGFLFTQTKAAVKASPSTTIVTNCCGFNFATATGTLWVSCDFNPTNVTIGTAANPVILIIDRCVSLSGNLTINGLLYIIGDLTLNSCGTIRVNGMVAVEGEVNMSGNSSISFDAQILTKLGCINPQYSSYYLSTEVFN